MRKFMALWLLLLPCVLMGQLTTDQVPRERTIATHDQVKQVVDKSQFRLGPFRVIPFLQITDAGYTDNALGTSDQVPKIDDYYAIVAGGVRWAVPAGAKLFVQGEIRPEYDWSENFPERRTFGGRYQVSLLGFFNRLTFELGGFNAKSIDLLNTQTQIQVIHTVRNGAAKVEIELTRNLSAYAGAEIQRHRYGFGGPLPSVDPGTSFDVSLLNRTEGAARAGVRLRFSPSLDVTAGVEGNRTEFTRASLAGDNEGNAYLIGLHYDRPRFFINLSGGYREGRPYNGSRFPTFSTPTGSYFASYFVTRKVEVQAYGGRTFIYGLFFNNPYYIETSNGVALNVGAGTRVTLRGFGEYSENTSPRAVALNNTRVVERKDRGTVYGGGFSTTLFRKMMFTALASKSRYTSNLGGFSRSTLRISGALTVFGQ
ncbi:MAG: hypothetical protein LC796_10085 [Acidobacteria bacterium]|nr:hypothetical protein [Acidobacteriota bacterium]